MRQLWCNVSGNLGKKRIKLTGKWHECLGWKHSWGSRGTRPLAPDPLSWAPRVISTCRSSRSDFKNNTVISRCFSGPCGTPETKAIFVKVGGRGRRRGRGGERQIHTSWAPTVYQAPGKNVYSRFAQPSQQPTRSVLSPRGKSGLGAAEARLAQAGPRHSQPYLASPSPCQGSASPAVTQPQLGKVPLTWSALWGPVTQSLLL